MVHLALPRTLALLVLARWLPVAAILLLVVTVAAASRDARRAALIWSLAALGCVIIANRGEAPRPDPSAATAALGPLYDVDAVWWVEGITRETSGDPWSIVRLLAVQPVGPATAWRPVTIDATVSLSGAGPEPGALALCRARLVPLRSTRNVDLPDRALSAYDHGRRVGSLRCHGSWQVRVVTPASVWRADRALVDLRRRGVRRLEQSRWSTGLLEAMALGERRGLDRAVRARFQALGWSHLLAVSGLHVGFAMTLAHLGVRRLARRWEPLVTTLAAGGYAALTGAAPSTTRAAIQSTAGVLGRAARRPPSLLRAVGLAAWVVLSVRPDWATSLSAQLSFAALVGIACFGRLGGTWLAWCLNPATPIGCATPSTASPLLRELVLTPLAVGLAASLGTLLVVAYRLHVFSPWGIVTAPLVIPWSALMVSGALLGLVLQPVLPAAAGVLIDGTQLLTRALAWLAAVLAARLPPPLSVTEPEPLLAAAWLTVAAVTTSARGRCRRVGAAGLVLCTALVLGWWPWSTDPRSMRVEFLDVGEGDAIVVALYDVPAARQAGRRPSVAYLIDTGDARGAVDAGSDVVVPRLRALGVRTLRSVFITHADRDHAGGLPSVAAGLRVRRVGLPVGDLSYARELEEIGVDPVAVAPGDTVARARGFTITCLHPSPEFRAGRNDRSLVLLLEAFGVRVLFCGDIEEEGEAWVLERQAHLQADVLKVAHHGSRTSSTVPFLRAVSARAAVISAGRRNRFDHPHGEVLARLEDLGAATWRTDEDGAVVLVADATGAWMSGAAAVRRQSIR